MWVPGVLRPVITVSTRGRLQGTTLLAMPGIRGVLYLLMI